MDRRPVSLLSLALMVAAVLLFAACGGDDDTETPTETAAETAATEPAATETAATEPAATETAATETASATLFNPVLTTADLAVGLQRVAFVPLQDGAPIEGEGETFFVRIFKITGPSRAQVYASAQVDWRTLGVESTEEEHAQSAPHAELEGIYSFTVEFDEAGQWGLGLTRGKTEAVEGEEVRISFEVKEETSAPAIGSQPPAVDNATLDDLPLSQVDTSPQPDEDFHEISIADALDAGRPALIAFATPAFCESRTCGPVMDVVNSLADSFGESMSFVHVEPFQLGESGRLLTDAQGNQQLSQAMQAWNLPSEPWVFILDKEGLVVGRYEGPASRAEIAEVVERLAKTEGAEAQSN